MLWERKRNCGSCGSSITPKDHECNRRYCEICNQNREPGHLCFVKPLKNELPTSERVLNVFYDFENTQDTRHSDSETKQVPNLVCIQQFCLRCEDVEDQDCIRCGKRENSFMEDPFGYVLSYLCQPRPWVNKVIVITHNAKFFDLHFILIEP